MFEINFKTFLFLKSTKMQYSVQNAEVNYFIIFICQDDIPINQNLEKNQLNKLQRIEGYWG